MIGFVIALGILAVFGVLAICRDSARREIAQTQPYMPTARQRRQWRRERADLNQAFRGRR